MSSAKVVCFPNPLLYSACSSISPRSGVNTWPEGVSITSLKAFIDGLAKLDKLSNPLLLIKLSIIPWETPGCDKYCVPAVANKPVPIIAGAT